MNRKILYIALILVGYKSAKFTIHHFIDTDDYIHWFLADTITSIFRMLALIATFWFLHSINKKIKTEFHLHAIKPVLIFFFCSQLLLWLRNWIYDAEPLGSYFFTIMLISNLLVGFFEEFFYRGALLEVCLEKLSPWRTIFLVSFIFMLIHFDSQPLYTFPALFLFGFVQVLFRFSGASLIVMAITHAFYDIAVYNFTIPITFSNYGWSFAEVCISLCFIAYMFSRPEIRNKFGLKLKNYTYN